MELSGATKKSTHLGYDFVNLPSGMMSSRSGNVISFQDLYNQVLQKAIAESTARHPEWRKSRIEKTAKKISVAVLKFEMLKVSPEKSITFSIEEALRFDGYTAIYIQYALARISGILKKINSKNIKPLKGQDDKKELEKQLEIEKNLMIFTARFPEIVNRAAIDRDPSEITKYLFELAKAFTDYYNSVPVVNSLPEIKPARIKNLKSVRQVITNGLKILGIEAVCEM